MKTAQKKILTKMGKMCASIAMLLAVSSVNSTCCFMLYQPEFPTELQEKM